MYSEYFLQTFAFSYFRLSDLFEFNKKIYYMPSTFYIVKLPSALGNIFNWTESIMAQSHGDAKNPYWGLNMDFWHCLIVMTYRNRAPFRLVVK